MTNTSAISHPDDEHDNTKMENHLSASIQQSPSTQTPTKPSATLSASKSLLPSSASKAKTHALLGALSQHSKSSCKKPGLSEQDTNESMLKTPVTLSSVDRQDAKTVSSLGKETVTDDTGKNDGKKYCSSAQKSLGSSSDSFGSLEELRKELIASVMKELSLENDSQLSLSTVSERTDSSEVHEVFKNSGLKVRGIDVENLLDADGNKLSIYNLFKARFQQPEYGKAKITNTEVVQVVDRFLQQTMNTTGRQFIANDENDYRKNAYDLSKDKNFSRFRELWEFNTKKQASRAVEATPMSTIQDFDF